MLCTGSDRLYRYFFTTVSELVSQSELWLCQTGSMAILVSWCAEPSQPRRVAWQQKSAIGMPTTRHATSGITSFGRWLFRSLDDLWCTAAFVLRTGVFRIGVL